MNIKLRIVISIIALGFVAHTLVPFILDEIIFDKAGIIGYDKILTLNLLLVISLGIIFFGARRLIRYADTAGRRLRNMVSAILYIGIFVLFLPYVLMFVYDYLTVDHPLTHVIAFIHKYMVHHAAALLLFIWGIKTAWNQRDNMEESPVLFSRQGLVSYFKGLGLWGWAFNIFIAALIFGYIYALIDASGKETPEGAVVTISVTGSLLHDPLHTITSPFWVEENDTVKKIHQIKKTRMLVTMANGSYGWFDIVFMNLDKGWNGYLFKSINTSDLKVSPERDSKSIPEADKEGFRKKYPKNTDARIIEMRRASIFDVAWAKVSIMDNQADKEVTGWLDPTQVRIHGQMHNNANYWIWIPLKWVNTILGDGFFAGLANVILMIFAIPLFVFLIVRLISTSMRFIPNFILALFLIVAAIGTLYSQYFSFFDPSAFNWGNWANLWGHLVYLLILLPLGFGGLKVLIQWIYEERCPECKYWEGYVYNRKLLSRSKNRHTTIYGREYKDGTFEKTGEKHEIHIDEDWKDFCECGKCGNRWTLRRHEHEKR